MQIVNLSVGIQPEEESMRSWEKSISNRRSVLRIKNSTKKIATVAVALKTTHCFTFCVKILFIRFRKHLKFLRGTFLHFSMLVFLKFLPLITNSSCYESKLRLEETQMSHENNL